MGFNLMGSPGGALTIRNVIAGSDAERAGLKEGDGLVQLDGTAASEMNAAIFRAAATRGRPLKVVVARDGHRLEFEVRPFVPKP
jgi:S1-C subfamily serine protease